MTNIVIGYNNKGGTTNETSSNERCPPPERNHLETRLGGGKGKFLQNYFTTHPDSRPKNAFTLAEVLITLGIIGVVAAMTMPSLIMHHKKVETSARLKKFISSINQALLFAENEKGMREDWEIGEINSHESSYNFLNNYIKPYVKSHDIEKNSLYGLTGATLTFLDGSQMFIKIGSCYDIYYDVNGRKLPNQKGRDIFPFILCKNKGCKLSTNQVTGFWCSADEDRPTDKERLYNLCKSNLQNCTMILEDNQWEIPDDYPVKL